VAPPRAAARGRRVHVVAVRARTVVASVLVLAALAYAGLSWHLSGEIIRFSGRGAAEVLAEEGLDGPAGVGLPAPEEVAVPVQGAVLSAWLFRHPTPAGCGVVLSHGHAATRHQALKFAPLFWARGCHLLLPDARHHGASSGPDFTWGARERHDLLEAVAALGRATGLPRSRIGLLGVSMGAALSLQAAALAPDLAFVVADSTFSDLPAAVRARAAATHGRAALALVPGTLAAAGLRAGFDPWSISPAEAAARIEGPVLLVHARGDAWFPPSHSEAVLARLPPARRRLVITDWGAEHGRSVVARPGAYAWLVDDFLAALAPGFGRGPDAPRPAADGPGRGAGDAAYGGSTVSP